MYNTFYNIYIRKMRMQIALIILITSFFIGAISSRPPDSTSFLIFSNDGTFYKLSPQQQHVHWHSDLGSKLISFEISQKQTNLQSDLSTYFIPTIEGHFVYIDKTTQILIHRQQIQPLLKICFGKSNSVNDLGLSAQQKYFLHQKFEYFFIDLHNGKLWTIETFFQDKVVVKQGRHGLIKISKKFLKQLKSNLDVKWSIISSTIDIIPAVQFLRDPKKVISTQETKQKLFEFRRTSNNQIQVLNIKNSNIFEMGSTSPIMAIFSSDENGTLFQKYPITFYKKPILAIQDKHEKLKIQDKNPIMKATIDLFPHSSQFKNSNKSNKKPNQKYQSSNFDLQYCLNTFRAIQQLHPDKDLHTNIPFIISKKLQLQNGHSNHQKKHNYLPLTQPISPSSHPHLFQQPQRSKQQPLIWIFIIGSLIISGAVFYKLKVGKLLIQLQKLQTQHDKKFQAIQKKLGQFEQMQKMYEVYWDKLLYRKIRRKTSDLYIQSQLKKNHIQKKSPQNQIETYEHLIFQGRFLNKEALVYAVPIDGIDLIHVEHQLNDLLSCSHKTLVKLYYYTKNPQFLLIFSEKIQPQWQSVQNTSFFNKFQIKHEEKSFKNIQSFTAQASGNEQPKIKNDPNFKEIYKNKKLTKQEAQKISTFLIKQIIDCITYLDSKIQIFSFPLQGIIINHRTLVLPEKEPEKLNENFEIQLKINTIPSILQVFKWQDDQSQDGKNKYKHKMSLKLRQDLVKIFYFVISKGHNANINQIHSMIIKEQNSVEQNFFVRDFYDFVLNENYNLNIEIEKNDKFELKQEDRKIRVVSINYDFLRSLLCHPFLWDSKRKIHFLTDFSNYIQTYLDDQKIKKLQSCAKDYQIIDTPWTKHLDVTLVREVNQFRKYDFNSVKDLIRLIRNKLNHFHQLPKQTRNSVGKTPEALIQYMLKLYPKLLSFAFVYAKRKKWKLHI